MIFPDDSLEGFEKEEIKGENGMIWMQCMNPDVTWRVPNNILLIYFYDSAKNGDVDVFKKSIDLWKGSTFEEAANIDWRQESDIDKSHIRVLFDPKINQGQSLVGRYCAHPTFKGKPTMVLKPSSKCPNEDYFKRQCIHEFGHALGLEHTHLDAAFVDGLNESQKAVVQKEMSALSKEKREGGIVSTGFDKDSVMNYSEVFGLGLNVEPSPKDKYFLQVLYEVEFACPKFESNTINKRKIDQMIKFQELEKEMERQNLNEQKYDQKKLNQLNPDQQKYYRQKVDQENYQRRLHRDAILLRWKSTMTKLGHFDRSIVELKS